MGSLYVVSRGISCTWTLVVVHRLSSLTRDRTGIPCTASQILNLWPTREVLAIITFEIKLVIFGCAWPLFSCGARASHCDGFSCCGAQALGAQAQ